MIRWRLLVAEALLLLLAARLLVTCLRFGLWRSLLGTQAAGPQVGLASERDRQLAKAVERATLRLPGESKCLPRAMALHWLLARRGRPGQLVIGVLPGCQRGALEDLHAWVECGDEVLIGRIEQQFRPLVRFNAAFSD